MQLLAAHRGRSLAPDTPGKGDNANISEVLKMQTMLLDTLNNRFAALELRLSGACGTPAWGVVEGTRTLFHASEYVPLVSCDTGQPAFYPWCSLDMGALGTFYETQTDTVLQEMEATHPDDDVQKSFNNTGASLPGRPSLPSEELPLPSEMLTDSAGNAGKNDSVQYSCVEGKMQGDNLAAVYSGGHMASPNVGELDSVSSSRPAWTPLLANTGVSPETGKVYEAAALEGATAPGSTWRCFSLAFYVPDLVQPWAWPEATRPWRRRSATNPGDMRDCLHTTRSLSLDFRDDSFGQGVARACPASCAVQLTYCAFLPHSFRAVLVLRTASLPNLLTDSVKASPGAGTLNAKKK